MSAGVITSYSIHYTKLYDADGRPVRVHCASGFRSYLAHRILDQEGVDSANFDGGMLTLQTSLPGLELETGAAREAATA